MAQKPKTQRPQTGVAKKAPGTGASTNDLAASIRDHAKAIEKLAASMRMTSAPLHLQDLIALKTATAASTANFAAALSLSTLNIEIELRKCIPDPNFSEQTNLSTYAKGGPNAVSNLLKARINTWPAFIEAGLRMYRHDFAYLETGEDLIERIEYKLRHPGF